MNQEEDRTRSTPTEFSDDELRAVLDEAERRKDAELNRKGRKVSFIIGVPVLLIFAWTGIFLLRYHASDDKVPALKPVIAEQTSGSKDMAGLEAFLPQAVSGEAPSTGKPGAGKIVDHEDIRFAMELLNYCRPPSAWKEDGKK